MFFFLFWAGFLHTYIPTSCGISRSQSLPRLKLRSHTAHPVIAGDQWRLSVRHISPTFETGSCGEGKDKAEKENIRGTKAFSWLVGRSHHRQAVGKYGKIEGRRDGRRPIPTLRLFWVGMPNSVWLRVLFTKPILGTFPTNNTVINIIKALRTHLIGQWTKSI